MVSVAFAHSFLLHDLALHLLDAGLNTVLLVALLLQLHLLLNLQYPLVDLLLVLEPDPLANFHSHLQFVSWDCHSIYLYITFNN